MKILTNLFMVSAVLAVQLTGSNAVASGYEYERVNLLSTQADLNPGHSFTVTLPGGWRQVRKLYVTAQAYHADATLQVLVNGDEKGRVFIPRIDPYYVVNVDETAEKITLHNRYGGGVIRISGLEAELSVRQSDGFSRVKPSIDYISSPALNEAAQLSRRAKELIDVLRPYADPETEYVKYLLPIKRVAGRALALANARGVGSMRVREALIALAEQIEFADSYVDSTLKKEVTWDLAVELLSLRDRIRRWLD